MSSKESSRGTPTSLSSKLNRRNFLQGSVLAGAGASILTTSYPRAHPPSSRVIREAEYRAAGPDYGPAGEPDMKTAFQWWSELPAKWTPIGWKDHMFRFNILFDGTIVADPFTNQRTEKWRGQGVQLSFAPSSKGMPERSFYKVGDDNAVEQGWEEEHPTPLLWSEWKWDGLFLRQHAFAHVAGGKAVESGVEPLFAWIRLSIHDLVEALPLEDTYGFLLKINSPHITHSMSIRQNILFAEEEDEYPPDYTTVGYPRSLLSSPGEQYTEEEGLFVIEKSIWERREEARVRLVLLPGQDCKATFKKRHPTDDDSSIFIELDVEKGRYVDLLLPMLPTDMEEVRREISLGYEGALAESDHFWSEKPDSAATFQTHDPHIDGTVTYGLKYAEMIAEKNPENGHYSLLTGSWVYCNLWATPLAFTSTWFLNSLGYHSVVEKYLRIFRDEQGKVIPPGDAYSRHPGYLSTPPSLTSIDWLSDHGALLYTVSSHALLSGNEAFIDFWTEGIVKACEFIQDARRLTNHDGFKGLMPPAVATDRMTRIQAVWNDGWAYKGLITAVRLLDKIDHPRAEEFRQEAADYREVFSKALREKMNTMPTWIDQEGRTHHLVPTSLFGETREELRHAFYIDTGPMFLVFAGLMNADEPEMRSAIQWFREGPQTRLYQYDSNCWQVPSLIHEVSSCEPNMSWSFFHTHQLKDREKFLEGMFSLFANHVSRQTYTNCETRGGVYGLTPSLTEVYLARLAVIDDQVAEGELHLLRLAPIGWLTAAEPARFLRMPTEFGPVSLTAHCNEERTELEVTFEEEFRVTPDRVALHVPPVETLESVKVNGSQVSWRPGQESVGLP